MAIGVVFVYYINNGVGDVSMNSQRESHTTLYDQKACIADMQKSNTTDRSVSCNPESIGFFFFIEIK